MISLDDILRLQLVFHLNFVLSSVTEIDSLPEKIRIFVILILAQSELNYVAILAGGSLRPNDGHLDPNEVLENFQRFDSSLVAVQQLLLLPLRQPTGSAKAWPCDL